MEKKIKDILEDLYKIDAGLSQHEASLIKLINKLLSAQPDTKLDQAFVEKLRSEIMNEADRLKTMEPRPASLFLNFMNAPKFAYALAGAVITLVLIIPVYSFLNQPQPAAKLTLPGSITGDAKIAQLSENAFGTLSSPAPAAQPVAEGLGGANLPGSETDTVKTAAPLAANQAKVGMAVPGFGGGGGSDQTVEGRGVSFPAPDIKNYQYQYVGEDINLSDTAVPVYRRVLDKSLGQQFAARSGDASLGLFNSGKLQNTAAANLQIVEDREFGYMAYIDFQNNMVSLSMNWEKWPQPTYEYYVPLKESEVPSDAKMIAMADAFLNSYGIDLSNLGEGVVNNFWQGRMAADSPAGLMPYIPDNVQVIYPYLIDGQAVYEQNGQLTGVSVEVNIRQNRVSGVNGLVVPSYESSSYQAVIDSSKVIKVAEKGGLNPAYISPYATETVTIELGTPAKQLVRYWHYEPDKGKGGSELFVPALVFPIINKQDMPEYWIQSVIVPLPIEILDNLDEPRFGIPEPMPLIEPRLLESGESMPSASTGVVEALEAVDKPE